MPTLRSRLNILVQGPSLEQGKHLVGKFIKAQKGERLELLKNIIEDKNKEEALYFLNNLESTLYKNKSKGYLGQKESVEIFGDDTKITRLYKRQGAVCENDFRECFFECKKMRQLCEVGALEKRC